MKKLTSIAEHSYMLELLNLTFLSKWQLHLKRVAFGKQPVEIWMFVPSKLVDGVWVVLEEPSCDCITEYDMEGCPDKCWQYINAKSLVLFEGFEPCNISGFDFKKGCLLFILKDYTDIESFLNNDHKVELELTKTAKNQIGI